ncbi:MAG TPA: tripartite tricarboxylate transporter substrate-binding protein, partial [Candidimonas sp.]|nr:tripartite tricarboxylate transporter substrate-binding protein [Candidimonas sp.]
GVATVREEGIPYDVTVWYGIIGPKGIPSDIQNKLNDAINAAVSKGEMAERLKATGEAPAPGSPASFQQQIVDEIALWNSVVKQAGIKVE